MEPAGSAAVVLLCAEDDDLELVRWVHAARQQGLAPEVVTGIERDDGPLLEALQLTTDALFVVLRSDNLGADRMRAIKACFALHHGPAQKLVALRLDGTAEAAVERIAKQIVGGVRSRSESSLLLAIEGVAPALERVIAVPASPASSRSSTPSHGIDLDAVPGLRKPGADGTHPAIAASRAARAAQDRRAQQSRVAPDRSVAVGVTADPTDAGRSTPSVAAPHRPISTRPTPGVVAPSRALPSPPAASAAAPQLVTPSIPLPQVVAPVPMVVVTAPAEIHDDAPAAPSLDHALAWAGRAHERARTGRYAIDDETQPMPLVDVTSPPVARAGSRGALTLVLAVLAVVATLGVTYFLLDATAPGTDEVAPATVIDTSVGRSGRVSIPVASEPSRALAVDEAAAPGPREPSDVVAPPSPVQRVRARPRAHDDLPAPPATIAAQPIAGAAQPLPVLEAPAPSGAPIDDALPSEPAPLEADLAVAAQ
jgi:hypothetical protein